MTGPDNLEAYRLVSGAPNWPARAACIFGPEGCGKTHLLRMWCEHRDAEYVHAPGLDLDLVSGLEAGFAIAVDDVDRLAGHADGEAALFHLFNRAQQAAGTILLSARAGPGAWPVALSDLRSRLSGVILARISQPDESLLRAVLLQELSLRQLRPKGADELIAKVLRRSERSLTAIKAFAAELDAAGLERRKDVTSDLVDALLKARDAPTDP